MSDAHILHWLSSIPQAKHDALQGPERPRKRHLPSPSPSGTCPSVSLRIGCEQLAMSTTPKRRRTEQPDSTPRPTRSASRLDGAEEGSQFAEESISSRASSKASKVSGSSSPRKQLRNAALQPTGFLVEDFDFDGQPPSLTVLRTDLMDIDNGNGILPQSLRAELSEHARIPSTAFRDSQDPPLFRYPSLTDVREIFDCARHCRRWQHGESSWNMEVHRRLFDYVLRDKSGHDRRVDYRYCLTADIEKQYKPSNAPSKMVDFCIAIKADNPETSMIRSLCLYRPGQSINHTDWGDLTEHPIAISVETKSDGEAYKPALLQISTWHSAQWRSLRWGGTALDKIEFLAGIIIVGDDWHFVATILGHDDKPITLHSLRMGGTDTLFSIYKLLAALQRLRQWAEEIFWPAFKADILGSTAVEE